MERTCAVEGCSRTPRRVSADLCNTHYFRVYRNGTTELLDRKIHPPTCTIEGCGKRGKSKGWCAMHLARWSRHGSTSTVIIKERSDDITYRSAHTRLRKDRGPATDQTCRHCDDAAVQWAYDHSDPDERYSEQGPYSLDQARYMPLCARCHARFDIARRRGVPLQLRLVG